MTDTQSSTKKMISDCFRKIGLPEPSKPEQFWKRLEKKHGSAARDFGNAVAKRESGDKGVNPYDFKNVSESLSLDITAQYESKLYRDFIEWLTNENMEPPTTILDLGCGNGVISILLSTLYPTSKIVAIDFNVQGVDIGRSVANRLGFDNIEWHVGDVTALQTELGDRKFDLIIALKVIHEVLEIPESESMIGHSISAFRDAPPNERNIKALEQLARHMTTESTLICVDRWAFPGGFGWWVRTAESVGLSISLIESYMLKTKENDLPETFPITVFSLESNLPPPSDEQLLGFFSYPFLHDLISKISPIEGVAAEALFLSFGNQKPIAAFVATWRNGSGVQNTSLFISGSISGIYTTWSTGLRSLYLAPAVAINSMISQFYAMAEDRQAACEVEIEESDCHNLLGQFGLHLSIEG